MKMQQTTPRKISSAEAGTYLAERGIKLSPQRVAVIKYLIENPCHPTAEIIYEALHEDIPSLSLTTVYNTLKLMASKNAVRILTCDSRTAHFDADFTPHAHFFCEECGRVFDVYLNGDQRTMSSGLPGFVTRDTELTFRGSCRECASGRDTCR